MFENIGFGELILIFIAALVVFGPKKLPELGKSLGQGIREFKKATQAITEEVTKAAVEDVSNAVKPAPAAETTAIAEVPVTETSAAAAGSAHS